MELSIEGKVLGSHNMAKMSLNPTHNILACIFDSADTLCFWHLEG